MKSWKTSTFGVLSACGAAVALIPGLPEWLSTLAKVSAAVGVAGLGLAARDNNRTSEDVGTHTKESHPPIMTGRPGGIGPISERPYSQDDAGNEVRRHQIALKLLLFSSCFLLWALFSGCTSFHVTQTDESPNERIIRSDIKATAWFSSAQSVAKLKALQTDKTQSFGTDNFGQQGSTNTVEALRAVAHILELLRPAP